MCSQPFDVSYIVLLVNSTFCGATKYVFSMHAFVTLLVRRACMVCVGVHTPKAP